MDYQEKMIQSSEQLANRLLYLPLDLREKVFLWLTYKGLKPVSQITAERRGNILALLKKGIKKESVYSFDSSKSKRIIKWIQDAGLHLEVNPDYDTEWHVGKDKDKVDLSIKIIREFNYDKEVESGILFGYPAESAKAYASCRGKSLDEAKKVMVGTGGQQYNNSYLKDKYFTPYVLYNLSKNRVVEDSKTAQLWADTIRHDIPKLAKWFEENESQKTQSI